MKSISAEGLSHVEGSLSYLADASERPVTYLYEPPAGTPARSGKTVRQTVPIYDARAVLDQLSLERQGFALVHQESAVSNFYDPNEVRAVYYPEVERMVKAATGASRVLVFDHNVRCAPMAKRNENGAREPVKFVHNDYTELSGPQRVRDLLPDEAEALLKHRFAVINVWRPISGPVQEHPLAVCDAQSMTGREFVPTDLRYRHRTGEVYSITYNPGHRWFYFPKMEKNEVMLLKCYDTERDGRARFTAHSAFDDPTSPRNAAPRESIEVRTIAFFAPAANGKN
jgi:hypothetical protein